jgi:FkbM family methyltransferase
VPRWAKRRARSVAAYPDTWRLVADVESFWSFRRFENDDRRSTYDDATVPIRFREVPDAALRVRPGTADRYLPRDTFFKGHHLPPESLDPLTVRTIWDLGCNIGFTIAHIATRYPRAHIRGVEIDAGNARLASRNVERWSDRCEVTQAAVWPADEEVAYRPHESDELSFHAEPPTGGGDVRPVAGLSLNSLLERSGGPGAVIDYVKMDIEGAEARVLKENVEWAERARAIKVEVHEPYSVEECTSDLRRLGFETQPIPKRRGGVTGLRRDLPPRADP